MYIADVENFQQKRNTHTQKSNVNKETNVFVRKRIYTPNKVRETGCAAW